MKKRFRNHWRAILLYLFGLLTAVAVFWGLKDFIYSREWIGLSAVATLLLAIAAFWTISETRYSRKRDREKERKARSAEELCKWAEEAIRLYYLPYNYHKEQIAQGLIGLSTKNMLMVIAATIIGDEFIEPTKRAEKALTNFSNMTRDRYYQKQSVEQKTLEASGKEFEEAFYPLLTYLYVLRYWDYDYRRFLEDTIENGKLKSKYQLSGEAGIDSFITQDNNDILKDSDSVGITMDLTKEEKDIMNHLIIETKPRIKRFKTTLIRVTIALSLFLAWLTYQYWSGKYGNVSHSTSLLIGGQFFALLGAALTATGASYKKERAALMSMTKGDGNPNLFFELMKTKIFTQVGLYFITFGFIIQAASMILKETIGL